MEQANTIRYEAIIGCILGTAIGDAIGLPYEGISRRKLQRLQPRLRQGLLFGRGMVSDDTEHTVMVSRALAASAGDSDEFVRLLSRQLKTWLLCMPSGAGLATAKATSKLLLGFPPARSGVFSAGNGPAMRSAIIGVCFGHDADRMSSLVRASTHITHTDPKAEYGALAVALAAYFSAQGGPPMNDCASTYLKQLADLLPNDCDSNELLGLIAQAAESSGNGESTASFAAGINMEAGISGYIYATVPVVLHSWFSHPEDYVSAITDLVMCGGDTDTTAAIAGGIIGASVGTDGIPSEWLRGLAEWPCDVRSMERLAQQLAVAVNTDSPQQTSVPAAPLVLMRNLLFLAVVMGHGFRRLLPPY